MKNSRRETRYFFQSGRLPEVISAVRNILGEEKSYEYPVTETVYFAPLEENDQLFPSGLRVRARRYIKELTSTVLIDDSPFFLEIKEEVPGGTNHKKKFEISGVHAIQVLSEANGVEHLPKLVPYVATQTLRYHWPMTNDDRLTLDTDIHLFGFTENSLFEAKHICDFEEGKLEFKLEHESQSTIEIRVVEATGCFEHDRMYLERRTRQCMKNWLNARQV